jgi:hypothetical protein
MRFMAVASCSKSTAATAITRRSCNHAQTVDLAEVIWPRERRAYDPPGALLRQVRKGARQETAAGLDRLAGPQGARPGITGYGNAVSVISVCSLDHRDEFR